MRILHTSDWHLGHTLYRRERDPEHTAFLEWLLAELARAPVDALIIAGDVFDVAQPGLVARTQYHDFLARVATDRLARSVVVIAGNHDSAGLIDVSKRVLSVLGVHVFGASASSEHAIVTVPGPTPADPPVGLVAAVPFLRGTDLHGLAEARQSGDVEAAIRESIAARYDTVLTAARARRDALGESGRALPLVATGHLHADGSLTVDESVRDIQIGRQSAVPLEVFGEGFDYVALGHLHREGRVFKRDAIRYSGAPIPMSFAEANGRKYVLRIEVAAGAPVAVERVEVPIFRPLLRLTGSVEVVSAQLGARHEAAETAPLMAWAEITLPGGAWSAAVRDELRSLGRAAGVDVLMVRSDARPRAGSPLAERDEALADLKPEEVFAHCLSEAELAPEEAAVLTGLFDEVLREVLADEARLS